MNYQLHVYISNRNTNVIREVKELHEAEVISAIYLNWPYSK
jgi:hypothetical protein